MLELATLGNSAQQECHKNVGQTLGVQLTQVLKNYICQENQLEKVN